MWRVLSKLQFSRITLKLIVSAFGEIYIKINISYINFFTNFASYVFRQNNCLDAKNYWAETFIFLYRTWLFLPLVIELW